MVSGGCARCRLAAPLVIRRQYVVRYLLGIGKSRGRGFRSIEVHNVVSPETRDGSQGSSLIPRRGSKRSTLPSIRSGDARKPCQH